jgi:hypothetical protein
MRPPNAALIETLYTSFQARDAAGMQRCYHADLTFRDPVFGELGAVETGAMWRMLCAGGQDLEVRCLDVSADDVKGTARWEARYTWGKNRRPVHNRIEASFSFADGLIVRHEDRFSLWAWSRQALGPAGWLLGWSPLLRRRIRSGARRSLERYMSQADRADSPSP